MCARCTASHVACCFLEYEWSHQGVSGALGQPAKGETAPFAVGSRHRRCRRHSVPQPRRTLQRLCETLIVCPVQIQTKDLRPLPGGYGRGSSTLSGIGCTRQNPQQCVGPTSRPLLNSVCCRLDQEQHRGRRSGPPTVAVSLPLHVVGPSVVPHPQRAAALQVPSGAQGGGGGGCRRTGRLRCET